MGLFVGDGFREYFQEFELCLCMQAEKKLLLEFPFASPYDIIAMGIGLELLLSILL